MTRLAGKTILDLKKFMLRKEALYLFKRLVRATKAIEPTDRDYAMEWIRHDFRRHKHEHDETKIRMLLAQGRAELRKLETALMLTARK
ncbi:hypothetical protein SeMB42_g00956 [Synchytrium endobioticum]|uniref:Complex 1 LYR protein domain-containing protein n=1 Tax=Synchytrium endobioticum TaxID=286115 RepID=A0A507DDN6_9FUNG|nr:hypothetical protein SeLEV6574_g01747 [Synchytrium endobioticum]TPX53173.1 hypothetical protein SeMB42_g00956 [Synchytrium endobioticum]